MKRTKKKLRLDPQTIRTLQQADLKLVAGAVPPINTNCTGALSGCGGSDPCWTLDCL